MSSLTGDDEGQHEPEERKRFGERNAEEHGRTDHAGSLRLTGHSGDGIADDKADADAGANCRAAVHDAAPDGGEAFNKFAWRLLGEEGERQWRFLFLVLRMHGPADKHGGEDREDERLQHRYEDLEAGEGDQQTE